MSYLADLVDTAPALIEPPRSWRATDHNRHSLNGTWRFHLSPSPVKAPHGAAETGFDDAAWDDVTVPSHWVLDPDSRWGKPIYTNVVMPIPFDPPYVPDDNPTGDYRLTFDLPDSWLDHDDHDDRVLLRFDGVESFGAVSVNGSQVGLLRGSRLPSEFDITSAARPHGNLLHVRVSQWSAQTWVEDQDQWWLPGIYRDVSLVRRPGQGIEDVWLRASYDHTTGRGSLDPEVRALSYPVTLSIDDLDLHVTWHDESEVTRIDVGPVEPWSADEPRLYDVRVANAAEQVDLRIGFRTVEIVGRDWLVNGRRLRLRGVNRHEFHPTLGRVFDEPAALEGLLLMKQHNVNAIRTSHYPPHPRLLDLADELGFWVIDECDLETHAFGQYDWAGNPTDSPEWHDALVQRMIRMVERDKNHPCIVAWSLGNEAGTGANLAAMANAARRRDPSRPIHYEGDYEGAYTDVVSRMYPPLLEMKALSEGRGRNVSSQVTAASRMAGRPLMLCEYAHAMGNGPGALAEYEEAFSTLDGWHGGFVWEWRDHGLVTRTADGVEYYGYGGDFGEVLHDGSFVMDGLVFADGSPSPGLFDHAAAMTPIRIEFADGQVRVTNLRHAKALSDVVFVWQVEVAGEPRGQGILDVGPLAAGETYQTPWPVTDVTEPDTWLTVTAELAEDQPWAPAGHVVAARQVRLDRAPLPAPPRPTGRVSAEGDEVHVGPVVLDRQTGAVTSIGGAPVVASGVELWRAPTENDSLGTHGSYETADPDATGGYGGEGGPSAGRRRKAGLDRLVTRTVSSAAVGDEWVVNQRLLPAQGRHGASVSLRWRVVDGDAVCLVHVAPIQPRADTTWGRIGFHLALATGYGEVQWYGTGPGEAYPDTAAASLVGLFSAPVDELAAPYAVPQETGHRPDLRRLTLSGDGVPGVTIETYGPDRPGFSVVRHDAYELTAAAHQHELPTSRATHLYLDAFQHGIGTRSCGPDVLPKYQLWPREADFGFRVSVD